MSYVIQNFNNLNKKITLTPRSKSIWLFSNKRIIIFFFQMKILSSFTWNKIANNYSIYLLFIHYLFIKQIKKYVFTPNLKFMGSYDNKLTRTSTNFLIKQLFLSYKLNIKQTHDYILNPSTNLFQEYYIFNAYLLPIKILMFGFTKFFYKNSFFYFLLCWSFIWYQRPIQLRFYLNFILTIPTLNIFKFHNNYFLKVYNY